MPKSSVEQSLLHAFKYGIDRNLELIRIVGIKSILLIVKTKMLFIIQRLTLMRKFCLVKSHKFKVQQLAKCL